MEKTDIMSEERLKEYQKIAAKLKSLNLTIKNICYVL